MTASRAINGNGYVSEKVRGRVLKAARALRYRPNVLARSLKGQRLRAIGIMLPDIANPFSAELVTGIQAVLDDRGYSGFLATASRSVEREQAALHAFVDHRVDGIIVATRGTEMGNGTIAAIMQHGVPVVTVGRPIADARVDVVTADHEHGAAEATSHLIALGHKAIGFVGVSYEHRTRLRRFLGYAEALKKHGIPLRKEWVVGPASSPAYATEQDGYDGVMQLLSLQQRPTAILVRNDFAAIGALHALQTAGLDVPGDIAVASFDNTPLAAYTRPPLTSVAQPIAEQGRRAAEFLLDRIEGRIKGSRRELVLPCQLVVRESTVPRKTRSAGAR